MSESAILSEKLSRISLSPILSLSRKSKQMSESGISMIDLTLGEPDFETPDYIKYAANSAIAAGKTKYTPISGDKDLIRAIQSRFADRYRRKVEDGNVIVTCGAKQAIHNAFSSTLNAGDEVILVAPYWPSYADMVRLDGGVVRVARCHWDADAGWRLDLAAVEKAVTPRTRWILLNSPCNPSGAVFDKADLDGLAAVMQRHPALWLLSDDIYDGISWPARPPLFADMHPGLQARTLIVSGVSKVYAMTGWRIGWAVGPSVLIEGMVSVQSQTTSAPSSVSQAAATAALLGPQDDAASMALAFRHRRDLVVSRLKAIPGVECSAPEGAFYAFPNVEQVIRRLGLAGDVELSSRLLEAGVATVPGTAFDAPGFLRISFAASMRDLNEACDKIENACNGW